MPETKKQTNPLVYIAIGCLVLLFLAGAGISVFLRFFAKNAVQGLIRNKTGVDISQVQDGKMTITDKNNGTKVNIGGNTVPDTFPKDFPLYPGAKVTSSVSGGGAAGSGGFWLSLSTTDSFDTVKAFYSDQLPKQGWVQEANTMYTGQNNVMETITKGSLSGSLSVTVEPKTNETIIVVMLGQKSETPAPAGQ